MDYILNNLDTFIPLILVMLLFSMAYGGWSYAPWTPTRKRDLSRIFRMLNLEKGQIFYDLGSGDGRIASYAAENFQAKAIGVEISLSMYLVSLIRKILSRNKAKYLLGNLFSQNIGDADALFLFALPKALSGKLIEKFDRELKPGTKILSYTFSIPEWQPVEVDKPSEKDLPIYLYIKK